MWAARPSATPSAVGILEDNGTLGVTIAINCTVSAVLFILICGYIPLTGDFSHLASILTYNGLARSNTSAIEHLSRKIERGMTELCGAEHKQYD